MERYETNAAIMEENYGVKISGDQTDFSVWSPSSSDIKLLIYKNATTIRRKSYDMDVDENGIWRARVYGNLEGQFYTYLLDDQFEVMDPYVQSTNANSTKGAILDAKSVIEETFKNHKRPGPSEKIESVIYEVHIKDFSMEQSLEFKHKGCYLAFTEKGLTDQGQKIGLDHLIELGISHVHIMPVYDFITVNDFKEDDYNWGYDPYLFNVLEGSYSSNPDDPYARIIEFKKLIMALHHEGIKVVLDVVYNHTYFGGNSNFHRLTPYVFHRNRGHEFTNGSGCGNEIDTEHRFVRKFILESLEFWLETYQVDGFRFDLMSLYDTEFVRIMSERLREIKPDILLYGEPWTAGGSGLDLEKQFSKGDQVGTGVSFFNDDFRNSIKGSNDGRQGGFIGMDSYREEDVLAGCFGSIRYNDAIMGFAMKPSDSINYVSSHDNLILMDKFSKSYHLATFEEKQNMNSMALAFTILSFGIPFIQAGTEFLRSKYGEHNSYKSDIYVNRMHWSYKKDHRHVFDFIKKMIEFRKSQRFYKVDDGNMIKEMTHIIENADGIVHYIIESPFEEDYKRVRIVYNGSFEDKRIAVEGDRLLLDGALYYNKEIVVKNKEAMVPALSVGVFVSNHKFSD